MDFTYLNLTDENNNSFYFNQNYLQRFEEDILFFLKDLDYMKKLEFAKSILNGEIKANNTIEGVNDDIMEIEKADVPDRIKNLSKGYKYILENKEINKETLKKLYSILSNNLLDECDLNMMGKYYRNDKVYILKGRNLSIEPYMGIDEKHIDKHMNELFEFINDENFDPFIKSQIMHFYFVYIHPYFDVNGRTSRTLSLWYLLNNNAYPFTIFTKAITYNQKEYEKNIILSKKGDITLFLKYMMKEVLKQLEKEYIIRNINIDLNQEEKQIIEYFISLNSNLTIKDLVRFYNKFNPRKNPYTLSKQLIIPLIDKNIFIKRNITKGRLYKNQNNYYIILNKDLININEEKLKYTNIKKYTI